MGSATSNDSRLVQEDQHPGDQGDQGVNSKVAVDRCAAAIRRLRLGSGFPLQQAAGR